MQKKEKELAAVLVATILLISGLAYMYSNQQNQFHNREPLKPLDRSIVFPRDEGRHNEPTEEWITFINISTKVGNFFMSIVWAKSLFDPVNSTVLFEIIDPANITGKNFRTESYVGRNYEYYHNYSRLLFKKNGNIFYLSTLDNKTKNYTLMVDATIDSLKCGLNMEMSASKPPTLLAQKKGNTLTYGTLYVENGTLYGYFQPRFSLNGTINLGNNSYDLKGKAMLFHYWGGSATEIFELLYAQVRDKDVLSITYYKPGGDTIALEQLYIVYNSTYTIYSTSNGETIGAYIKNGTYKDLHGETYALYPTSYMFDPTDPYHGRVYARNWSISSSYDNLKIELHPILDNQFTSATTWIGAANIKENGKIVGWGFSALTKRYISAPYVDNIEAYQKHEGKEEYLIVNATVSDGIPVEFIRVYYNTSAGEFFVNMEYDEDAGHWTAKIGPFNHGEKVEYRVYVKDLAGNDYSKYGGSEVF